MKICLVSLVVRKMQIKNRGKIGKIGRKLLDLSGLIALLLLLISFYLKEYEKKASKTKLHGSVVKTPKSTDRVIDKALISTFR